MRYCSLEAGQRGRRERRDHCLKHQPPLERQAVIGGVRSREAPVLSNCIAPPVVDGLP